MCKLLKFYFYVKTLFHKQFHCAANSQVRKSFYITFCQKSKRVKNVQLPKWTFGNTEPQFVA